MLSELIASVRCFPIFIILSSDVLPAAVRLGYIKGSKLLMDKANCSKTP